MNTLECLHDGFFADGDLTREVFFPQHFQFVGI